MHSEVKELRRKQIEVENYVKDQHTIIRNRDAKCRELVKVIKFFRDDKAAAALTSPRGEAPKPDLHAMEHRLILAHKDLEGLKGHKIRLENMYLA